MKVVIDTNVVVSAVLRDREPELIILWLATQSDWEWIVTSEILTEYQDVLSRDKFALSDDILQQWYAMFLRLTRVVDIDTDIEFPRDQKDAKFIACALAVQADYFITGDKDFVDAKKILNTTILSVSRFRRLIIDTLQ